MSQALGKRVGKLDGGQLLGRRSYEQMLTSWTVRGGPYKDALNVVSTSDDARLAELHGRTWRHPRQGG